VFLVLFLIVSRVIWNPNSKMTIFFVKKTKTNYHSIPFCFRSFPKKKERATEYKRLEAKKKHKYQETPRRGLDIYLWTFFLFSFCFENKKRHSTRHALTIFKLSERHLRSKIRWLTELCNSHYVSHFAAFFIDTRAKRSTVESCGFFIIFKKSFFKKVNF